MYSKDNLYSKDHEWIAINGDVGTIGITDFAQQELGDVVYVDLPEVGDTFEMGEPFGSVESVKAVSEIFSPVAGEVVEVNAALRDAPELINQSPHEQAWMIKLRVGNAGELKNLLSAEDYQAYIKEQK